MITICTWIWIRVCVGYWATLVLGLLLRQTFGQEYFSSSQWFSHTEMTSPVPSVLKFCGFINGPKVPWKDLLMPTVTRKVTKPIVYHMPSGGAFTDLNSGVFQSCFHLEVSLRKSVWRVCAKALLEFSEPLKSNLIFMNSIFMVWVVGRGGCLECCVCRLFSPCRWSVKTRLRKSCNNFWLIFMFFAICDVLLSANFQKQPD